MTSNVRLAKFAQKNSFLSVLLKHVVFYRHSGNKTWQIGGRSQITICQMMASVKVANVWLTKCKWKDSYKYSLFLSVLVPVTWNTREGSKFLLLGGIMFFSILGKRFIWLPRKCRSHMMLEFSIEVKRKTRTRTSFFVVIWTTLIIKHTSSTVSPKQK